MTDTEPLRISEWPPKWDAARLAAEFDLSTRTLERWRAEGTGPPFVMVGGRVFYLRDDVLEWLAARRCRSTAERLRRHA